jgi:hypothetical protein
MIDPGEIERRRLERLDSPRRIVWLRDQVRPYAIDLAARSYFRLKTWCAGQEVPDPKAEVQAAFIAIAASHHLTPDECAAAFRAEWSSAMNLAVQAGEKLKIAALSHIKASGGTDGLEAALQIAKDKFPAHWPYLGDTDLAAIAAGFRRPAKARRAA